MHVLADNQRLKQVLLNLVANGVKYNHAHGSVSLSWEERPDGRVRLAVRDTGPGIPAEHQSMIFEPFEHLEPLQRKHTPGVGLGLTVVKELVQSLGGRIEVESQVGQGSTFTVVLPSLTDGAYERPSVVVAPV